MMALHFIKTKGVYTLYLVRILKLECTVVSHKIALYAARSGV